MTKFRCKSCNYSFEKELEPLLCPNCGEKETVNKEESAEDLVDSVD